MKMKTVAKTLLLPLILVAQSACAFDFILAKQQRSVGEFSTLEVSGLAEVYLSQGEEGDIEVKVAGIDFDDVITRNENDRLIVTTKGFHRGETVKVYVNYQTLEAISVGGAAKIYGQDTVIGDKLSIYIKGAGDAELDVDVNALSIDMKGAGNLDISGHAHSQNVRSHGSQGSLDNGSLNVGE